MNQLPRTGLTPPGIYKLSNKDKAALSAAYMRFVKNGGLFVSTTKEYRLGDEVFMLLTLMEDPERIPIAGKVVWVTPRGAQNKRPQGIGVQFSASDNGATQRKVEGLLAGALGHDRPSHTL